jgi:hypothetical protein
VQFNQELGFTATKPELSAILQFVKQGHQSLGGIGITVTKGNLLVQASDGSAACYHRGEASDGKGGSCSSDYSWQVAGDALASITKSMDAGDEVVLCVNKKGKLHDAIVRNIESGQAKIKVELTGHVGEQLGIDTDDDPGMPPSGGPHLSEVVLSPGLVARVAKVSKASGGGVARWTMPRAADGLGAPVYIEIDLASRLADGDTPAWTVVVAPMQLSASDPDMPDEDEVEG